MKSVRSVTASLLIGPAMAAGVLAGASGVAQASAVRTTPAQATHAAQASAQQLGARQCIIVNGRVVYCPGVFNPFFVNRFNPFFFNRFNPFFVNRFNPFFNPFFFRWRW